MKQQQEIVRLNYRLYEQVIFEVPSFFDGRLIGTRLARAAVMAEMANRPGWYYVRENESGEVHLVQWTDLSPADLDA